jgi:ribosomal protein L37AE/L43A
MVTYRHKCPFCGHKWEGRKATVVACIKCKRRFDYPKLVPGKQAALQYIEQHLLKSGMSPTRARKEASVRLQKILGKLR